MLTTLQTIVEPVLAAGHYLYWGYCGLELILINWWSCYCFINGFKADSSKARRLEHHSIAVFCGVSGVYLYQSFHE